MVCSPMNIERSPDSQAAFEESLRALLDREDYILRGVTDGARFDRYVRSLVKTLIRMAKANAGFENTGHYQEHDRQRSHRHAPCQVRRILQDLVVRRDRLDRDPHVAQQPPQRAPSRFRVRHRVR